MNDQSDDMNSKADSPIGGALMTIFDVVKSLITGKSLPVSILRNALKAFEQLSTAALDIPVAHFEGIAAEKRAETHARVQIISTSADQIAAQMNVDPEYAQAAVKKYSQKILRERINLDQVSRVAAYQIQEDAANYTDEQKTTNEVSPINDDWLNHFEKEASQKSTEEMQLLFGRILAGEIQKPSSFSIKTVKLLGELDSHAAALFRRLCSVCISIKTGDTIIDARVPSLGSNAASNSLQNYGLSFGNLNILNEYGLIISDYNSYMDYRFCIADENRRVPVPLVYQNRYWGLVSSTDRPDTKEFRLHGVSLSRVGKELMRIVDIEPNEEYSAALQNYFQTQKLSMVKIAVLAA